MLTNDTYPLDITVADTMKNNIILLLFTLSCFLGGLFYWQKTKPVTPPLESNISEPSQQENKQPASGATESIATAQNTLSKSALLHREQLKTSLLTLLNCPSTYTCPEDNSDPRASSILLGKMLANKLRQYIQLHLDEDYFDTESLAMTQAFIDYPDGHVQEQAIILMSNQPVDLSTAQQLIKALNNSYDAKIMKQSMLELQRYPSLELEIRALFQQTLETGSFLVAQEVAKEILPFLTSANIENYNAIAEKLPHGSKRSRYLLASIKEFQLRQTGG